MNHFLKLALVLDSVACIIKLLRSS